LRPTILFLPAGHDWTLAKYLKSHGGKHRCDEHAGRARYRSLALHAFKAVVLYASVNS
jgi:hypothetical protein